GTVFHHSSNLRAIYLIYIDLWTTLIFHFNLLVSSQSTLFLRCSLTIIGYKRAGLVIKTGSYHPPGLNLI
ncbi:MAG: hypothetical protein M3286_08585, partial [Thermoproteota archaeon]|nr:hypothetical protein [Thermoproteota archaeon]